MKRKDKRVFICSCLEKTHTFDHIFKNQIRILNITMVKSERMIIASDLMNRTLTGALSKFTNLEYLKFHPYSDLYIQVIERLSFKS